MAKQITDNASKSPVAAADVLLVRDVTSNTDKKTTISGIAPAVAANIPAGAVSASQLAGVWWEELGRTTLAATADAVSVTIPARKFLKIIYYVRSVNATTIQMRFNGDTSGSKYAFQYLIVNNAAVSAGVNAPDPNGGFGTYPNTLANNDDAYGIAEIYNPSGRQKLINGNIQVTGQSATQYDSSLSFWGHWVDTNQITSISITNLQSGDYAIGTEIVVLGHD